MPKPNFFIVGAPKCGTTAMNDYLSQHPDIFMAEKELHYFGSDIQYTKLSTKGKLTEQAYLAYFEAVRDEKRIGESSVWYLSSTLAPKQIHEFVPDARIIIMIREPVDMLYSYYYNLIFNGNEDKPTFEAALAAENERRQGRDIPKTAHNISGLFYRDMVDYATHIQRYYTYFGRNQVHIIVMDDLKANVAQVYRDTLTFLDVDPNFEAALEVVNPNRVYRSRTLMQMLNFPSPLQANLRALVPSRLRRMIGAQLRKMNTTHRQRQPLTGETRRELQAHFAPGVDELSQLLGRDLSHWYQS